MTHTKRERTQPERQVYAIVNALSYELHEQNLTEDDLWTWVRTEYDVQSRTELTEQAWAIVAARLHTAQSDSAMFSVLCANVRACLPPDANEGTRGLAITQRKDKRFVDIQLGGRSCLVNLDTQKVRGRKMDIFCIVEAITGESARWMTRELMDKAILKHIQQMVSPAPVPTPDSVKAVLVAMQRWTQVSVIAESLKTENTEAILAALRVLYRQKLVAYKQVGAAEWFRYAEGGKV